MKTPEQIAQDIADRYDYAAVGDLTSPEQVHDMISAGIEADRAQRDPNPVLVYYRAAGVPDDWEQDLVHLAFMHTPEHIDHARKVLERLAAL